MKAASCPACGAWWLPGAEQCPAHRRDDLPPVVIAGAEVPRGAPRVYPEPEPFTARWWQRHHPLSRIFILGPVR